MIRAIKRFLARRALERSLRPDPQFRANMLSQFSRERRERYEANVRAALHPDSD
jgi:Tfp pilus assembly protein PilF